MINFFGSLEIFLQFSVMFEMLNVLLFCVRNHSPVSKVIICYIDKNKIKLKENIDFEVL